MKTQVTRPRRVRRRRIVALAAAAAVLVLPVQALGGDQVPFLGADQGAWGIGSHDCGALLPVFVANSGQATHVGRYAYSSQECVNLGAATYAGTFSIQAANGDTLVGSYAGTFTVDTGGNILYEQTNTVTGGTGRFADASGSFALSGFGGTDGACLQELAGAISSVGSSK